MGQSQDRLIDQASDAPCKVLFFFHNFLQNSLQKSLQFFLSLTLQKKIETFKCLSPGQQPTVLFSIDQNNTWTIRCLVDETINPAYYIEDFRIFVFIPEFLKNVNRNLNQRR